MENSEEILHSLEEFSKFRPKDIPRELEEYLCFVAKTGDPIYQWASIKYLFKEKLINVVNEFYETCPLVDIPPCPNVEIFNYDNMKSFILEKLETFVAAPFTVQRICELLTTPRKEYNRIDKFMRALEKNILVVSTVEPGSKSAENGESIVNGIESDHLPETSNYSSEINVVEMEESSIWNKKDQTVMEFQNTKEIIVQEVEETLVSEVKDSEKDDTCSSSQDIDEEHQKCSTELENTSLINTPEQSDISDRPVEMNVDSLTTEIEGVVPDPVVSSEALYENNDSEAVSSAGTEHIDKVKDDIRDHETPLLEDSKQADSTTTNSKAPNEEETSTVELNTATEIKPTEVEGEETISTDETNNCIPTDNENIINDSNQNSNCSETISSQDICENETDTETDSNEAKNVDKNASEENVIYDEGSLNSASSADTTKECEVPGIQLEETMEDSKGEEEISSSDKVVPTLPNTSIDDISDDESEAVAEVKSQIPGEEVGVIPQNPVNSEDMVTASGDESKNNQLEVPMEVDSKEKGDSSEAETTCESSI